MRKKKPEELIPPSPNCGVLNSELLRIILPEHVDFRTRKQLPKDLRMRLIAEDNERMVNPPDPPWYRPHPLAEKKDEGDT